jgi:hypothetical protein
MKLTVWITALVVAAIGAGVFLWQVTLGESEPAVQLPATPTITATPELANAKDPDEALMELYDVPNIGPFVESVTAQDATTFLDLVAWERKPCGSPRGNTAECPQGVAEGSELDMVDVGDLVPFFVTRDRLALALERLFKDQPLPLSFASQGDMNLVGDPGDYYLVAFEGSVKDGGLSQIPGFPTGMTGFFLVLDASNTQPLESLNWLTAEWTTQQQIVEFVNNQEQEIISWPAVSE